MNISIIVPAYNEEKLLAGVLENLKEAARAFEGDGWSAELIVCDNNSTDRTAEIARASGAKVVFEPVNQIARARNRGASAATGDWLLFLDADSWPSRELFAEVRRQMVSGGAVGGGAVVQYDERFWWADFLVGCWNRLSRLMGWAAGSLVYCRAEAFRAVGGFSNELYAAEEIDLSKKLKKWGAARKLRMRIISTHALKTSARKAKLYTLWDHASLLFRGMLNPRKMTRTKEACTIWYDGRR